jgi:hypothetical protein
MLIFLLNKNMMSIEPIGSVALTIDIVNSERKWNCLVRINDVHILCIKLITKSLMCDPSSSWSIVRMCISYHILSNTTIKLFEEIKHVQRRGKRHTGILYRWFSVPQKIQRHLPSKRATDRKVYL